ncbi:MAG: peptidase S9, partial [Schleiferiaceae bacterium]|nr:peptidase S9 [Schleiferiaceae bacterium]
MKKIAFALLLAPFLTVAQTMSPELLWELGRVSLDAISPDGKTAIYGVTRYNLDENKGTRTVYSIPTKGGEPKVFLQENGSAYGVQYIKEGTKIAYTANGGLKIANADGSNAMQIGDIEGGHDFKVFDLEKDMILVLYSKAVKMMKNTKDLYPNLDKAEAMVIDNLMYRHWNYWNDESFEHLHYAIIDLADGNKIMANKDIMPDANWDVPVPPFDGSEDYTLSPDGKTIVYVAKPKFGLEFAESTNTDLYAYNLETEQTVNLTEGMMGYDENPSFSPDGKLLAFTSMERDGYESDANLLWIMNMET